MLKIIGSAMTAFATALTIIVSIDYFCKECLKNFFWTQHSQLLIGTLAGMTALLVILFAAVYFSKKLKQNKWDIEIPEGQVPLNSSFYIERPPIEPDCYETILKPDALIRIKAPRQMGKTSLMTRVLHHAKHQGKCRIINLSFQETDSDRFANLEHFLQWFSSSVTEQLELPDKVTEYWQKKKSGNKRLCSKYFKEYLLTEITQPIVLGLDEVDRIFNEKIAADFFGLLRTWHENGKNDEAWKRFRMVITHSQEVYIELPINQSPFNVGTDIELPEFNRAQMQELIGRHKLSWTDTQIDQLMAIVGGHPHLVRIALYQIARGRITLNKLLKTAANEKSPYSDHLRRHLHNLQEHPELTTIFKQVITTKDPIPVKELGNSLFKLCSMGLIKIDEENRVMPSYDLYRRYFKNRLCSAQE
jgi:hypothetical protein